MKNKNGVHDMSLSELIFILLWIAGIVVVEAGWSTFFAIIFPPWAFYSLIELALTFSGVM